MATCLYIDELRTDTSQKHYRSEYALRHADYELCRTVNHKGVISSEVFGGKIRVVIDGFGDENLFNWLFDPAKRMGGEVVVTDSHEKVLEKFIFANAKAIRYKLHFDANSEDAVSAIVVMEAGEITTENDIHYESKKK